jgi:hypothetical protein
MLRRFGHVVALAMTLGLATGCGRGLTVNLTSTPPQASPGDAVNWTVSVRNDTDCATVGLPIPLPSPLPAQAGAFVIFFGATPGTTREDAAAVCQQFLSTPFGCSDLNCLAPILEEALGAESAERIVANMRAAAQAAQDGAQPPLPAGTCATLTNNSNGFVALCAFDPLDPDETDTAMYSDMIQGSGVTSLLAFALAPALGDDCRPGTEVNPDEWYLSGCFPLPAAAPAPALSPTALYVLVALLVGAGVLGLKRMRA